MFRFQVEWCLGVISVVYKITDGGDGELSFVLQEHTSFLTSFCGKVSWKVVHEKLRKTDKLCYHLSHFS